MFPFYAAIGHPNYAKSVCIYIPDMLCLDKSKFDIFNHFLSGGFVIHRADCFCGGLSTDLVIEQVLMRSLKTRLLVDLLAEMDEKQRTRWLLAMPACVEVNYMIHELTHERSKTSEQHKDMSEAKRVKDQNDAMEIFTFLTDHNPFESNVELHNISTPVTGVESPDHHKAVEVGDAILKTMEGQNTFQYSFRKNNQLETFGIKVTPPNGDLVSMDPQLLFQKLLIISLTVI